MSVARTRKIIALAAAGMLFVLVGCGNNGKESLMTSISTPAAGSVTPA
jgi:hypothetical protein